MKKLFIIHCGVGNIGRELVEQISGQEKMLSKEFGVQLIYSGLFTSSGGFFDAQGFPFSSLPDLLNKLRHKDFPQQISVAEALSGISSPVLFIDTTASDQTISVIKSVLQNNGFAVLSNKKPLAASQSDFSNLHTFGRHRFFYETTVGAGLPVISTLKTLLATGDKVLEIQGCFSGTLGFIFSELEKGRSFSQAVIAAKEQGFTEPNPRDDLSGMDVARKALILSRLIGVEMELKDVALESLYPQAMEDIPVETFLSKLTELDNHYKEKVMQAKVQGKVLRYVATVSPDSCRVGLEAVENTSDIGSLQGPDNIIVFKTERYKFHPLIIKGPGAGIQVTAAGVFGDIIEALKSINDE